MTVKEYNNTVELYSDNVYRFILKNIRDEEKAKDIVQDSFVKLWQKVEEVAMEKAKSYLFTTAYRTMIDLIRREKKQGNWNEVVESSYSHQNQYTGVGEVLQEALKKLSDIQRSVIMLRDYEGYDYSEIGEITNLSLSQVKVYIFRGEKNFKRLFSKCGGGDMKENINLENYEAFFLDYSEGKLSVEQTEELNRFLEKHPELRNELEEFEQIILPEDVTTSPDLKNSLIKEESTLLNRSEYLMIAQVEGEITEEEKKELSALISSEDSLIEELAYYHKTILKKGEEEVIFNEKSKLVQKETRVIVWWRYASAIAAAILALFLFNLNDVNKTYSPKEFSWKETSDKEEKSNFAFFVKSEEKEKSTTLENKVTNEDSFLAESTPKKEIQNPIKNKNRKIIPNKVTPIDIELADRAKKEARTNEEENRVDVEELKENVNLASNDPLPQKKEKFVPIQELAKNKIKNDVLKGKTFSETVMEELEEISNEKITFETKKNKKGDTQKFAINIGKFSFSRNK